MLGGCVAILVGLYGAAFVLIAGAIAAERPDPTVPDGDPCCPYPDTWQEVWIGIAGTLGLAVVDSFIFMAAAAMLSCGAHGRSPRLGRLLWIPAGYVVFAAGLMAVSLAATST
jgi:hypothetical protein